MYDLPLLITASRGRRRLNIRDAAQEIGCAVSTVSRIENGYGCDVNTLALLLFWLENE
jgi:transcriptional regulator with XRE-family HTH domain